MNKCPVCGTVLVSHEIAHALNGKLFCSRSCAIKDAALNMTLYKEGRCSHNQATEWAKDAYDARAEVVRTEDVLGEDLQSVQIAVTYYKTIKLPKCYTERKACEVAEKLWIDGLVRAEPDDCDDATVACMLVKDNNSKRGMED